jgi:hypothetical protein
MNKKIEIMILVIPVLIFIPKITVNSFSIIANKFFVIKGK